MDTTHEQELETQSEPEPYATISKLVSRIRISRDKATTLLLSYGWNEQKFDSNFLLSDEYERVSKDIVNNPKHDFAVASCPRCWNKEVCQNIGCGHYLCNRCILVYINSEVTHGEVRLSCPVPTCSKYIRNDFIKSRLSQDELIAYDNAIKQSYERRQTTEVKKGV